MMKIETEEKLDDVLSQPGSQLIEMMRRMNGDILILGIAGKMGMTLGRMAVRAVAEAGANKRVIGVSRFSDNRAREWLEDNGVETIACDLLDADAVALLPDVDNVIFMVGRKFGTAGAAPLTWGVNTLATANACQRYPQSRIVAFSTGCVYPLADVDGPGCSEQTRPQPVGEYAQACLGRERIFQYFCDVRNTPVCLYRLNYAIDLRYGVLHDIARWIWQGQPVPLNVPAFNCIWQRDANERALLCLEHGKVPAEILNVSGAETVAVRDVAIKLGQLLGREVSFTGDPGATAYLVDASESVRRFGEPVTSLEDMLEATSDWIKHGGASLNKPTHFEVSNGVY